MSDDIIGKVAALEVYTKNHAEKLKEVSSTVEDLYNKYDMHEKEYREILLQLQGICSEFSEFAIKLKEFETSVTPIPGTLEAHIKDLYAALNNGWWLTAQNINSNLILSGIYDQTMKDTIQVVLDSYVLENY